ncbi:hypothetical protein DFR29_11823 [Tahibacter aquaticus]|uniref:Uncharacterized protein n=1 Tax=Tahibacter aquaticus TaxID=520092 RepID=A0A4R6YMY5_9GAMM|nr:hypothetical protein [Tahibacter aquaticus]TDR38880.1 hypothetical protein DFR29_11823 [Tahibacter aquaticus]
MNPSAPLRWLLLLALALFSHLARPARQDVTFILASDNPGHQFFAAARDYYATRPALAGTLVTSARSLAEVREFLLRSPLRGNAPWGRVRLVAHGSQWQGLRVPVFAEGALATAETLDTALVRQEFPPLPAELLDRDSVLRVESCGLGRRPAFLRQLGRLFSAGGRLRVEANEGYVWFRQVQRDDGHSDSVREELPYRAQVVAGAAELDDGLRERLRRQWQGELSAPLAFVAVPLRIDVPLPLHGEAGWRQLPQPPEALAALRNYGLRWSQLRWQVHDGRLQGLALIVVAAADAAALDRQQLGLSL